MNPDDIRSFRVTLTDKALALVPQAREIHKNWIDDITGKLTDLEKRNFLELLKKVADTANEISQS